MCGGRASAFCAVSPIPSELRDGPCPGVGPPPVAAPPRVGGDAPPAAWPRRTPCRAASPTTGGNLQASRPTAPHRPRARRQWSGPRPRPLASRTWPVWRGGTGRLKIAACCRRRRPTWGSARPRCGRRVTTDSRRRRNRGRTHAGAWSISQFAGNWADSAESGCAPAAHPLDAPLNCGCGGIGRRAGLKIRFRKECRFESDHPHQSRASV